SGGEEHKRDGDAEQGREKAKMIEVVLNDRLGKKVRVKCNDDDTIGDLKKLDYEIHDGMGLELYYN
ncbi:unnamed protein product, partial [Musa acuminata subsp. burmannicoides]